MDNPTITGGSPTEHELELINKLASVSFALDLANKICKQLSCAERLISCRRAAEYCAVYVVKLRHVITGNKRAHTVPHQEERQCGSAEPRTAH